MISEVGWEAKASPCGTQCPLWNLKSGSSSCGLLLLLPLYQVLLCTSVWFSPHLHAPPGPGTHCVSSGSWWPPCGCLGLLSSCFCCHTTKASPDAEQPSLTIHSQAPSPFPLSCPVNSKSWQGHSTGVWVCPFKSSSLSKLDFWILKFWRGFQHGPQVPLLCWPYPGLSCFGCALRSSCYCTSHHSPYIQHLWSVHTEELLFLGLDVRVTVLPFHDVSLPCSSLSSTPGPPRPLITACSVPVVPASLRQMLC